MKKEFREVPALHKLSEEHARVLEVCQRIRTGLLKNVEATRMRSYAEWFKKEYLEKHFRAEEELIFPLLGNNARVKKALANHRRILKLLSCSCDDIKVLNLLEEELSTYIRFEERILYKEIYSGAPAEKLLSLEKKLEKIPFNDLEWEDPFWRSIK